MSYETQSSKKKNYANKSTFYCLSVKKKTSCVSLSYIFPRLTYKMKDEMNSLPIEVKKVFTNTMRYINQLKNFKRKTSFGSSKCVKKISGLFEVL